MRRARAPRSRTIVLRGSLTVFPPWQVMQWVAQDAPEGVLVLECRREGRLRQARLHCRDGVLISLAGEEGTRGRLSGAGLAPRSDRLGGVLVAGGALSVPRLRLALALQAQERGAGAPARPLGRALVAAGAISREALEHALRALAYDRFTRLVSWRRGRFRFCVGAPGREVLPVGVALQQWLIASAADRDAARSAEPHTTAEG